MQQPRGPATLCIKAKEIDALYDALGKIQRAFAAAAIPWTLTGGSALGAVRSASILFCDDDIDLARLLLTPERLLHPPWKLWHTFVRHEVVHDFFWARGLHAERDAVTAATLVSVSNKIAAALLGACHKEE